MSVAVVLLLTTVGPPAQAAGDVDAEAGLCRVINIDEIAEMTGQQYEGEPVWDLPDNCKYLATSDPDGFHFVRVQLDDMAPWDLFREGSLDPADLEIDGQRAFGVSAGFHRNELNTQVAVDLVDVTLRVTLIADKGADVEQMDNAIRIAEIVVANLDYQATPPETPDAGADSAQPSGDIPRLEVPVVDGFEIRAELEAYGGAEVADLEAAGFSLPLEILLDALGADISQLGIRMANVRDAATNENAGVYLAVRVVGTDVASMEPAVLAWLADLAGMSELPVEPMMIGGREVLLLTSPEEAYLYFEGDTVHVMSVPEAAATGIVETLP